MAPRRGKILAGSISLTWSEYPPVRDAWDQYLAARLNRPPGHNLVAIGLGQPQEGDRSAQRCAHGVHPMARGAVTLKDGRVEQHNFDAYTPPYMIDAPVEVDVHIVPSTEPPSGCGEPPVPVISPAVVNALAQLTGTRYRSLPLVAI